MSIVLDPSKNFVAIQIMYIEEQDEKHGNTKYHFINSRAEFNNWKSKGYLTEEGIDKAAAIPPEIPQKNPPVASVQHSTPKPSHDPTKVISVLRTWWSRMNWEEQNQIYSRCLRQIPEAEGKVRTELDMIMFRDMKLKTCLKKWDLKDDNKQDIPITESIINQLVPEAAHELLNSFEKVTEASENELGE